MKERGSLEGKRGLGLDLWSCCSGAAGLVCAETLRQEGFSDRIVLCTLDRHLPYDRAKLSKVGMEWGTWILIPPGPCPQVTVTSTWSLAWHALEV